MAQVPVLRADGPAIRARRRALGLTAAELARKIRRHHQTIRRLEAGRRQVASVDLMHQIAWALDTSVDELTMDEPNGAAA